MSAFVVPEPKNEVVKAYAPGSPERLSLKATLRQLAQEVTEIPQWIGGERVKGTTFEVRAPHDHQKVLGRAHAGDAHSVTRAIDAARAAKKEWGALPYADRAAVFLRAADLLAGPFRDRMNAATMLGQSKTVFQAEIDAACELCDFWRFNAAFGQALEADQPYSPPGQWNRTELRPLDGFVFAVSPFNFTSIAANLPTAPALMGNTVVWKAAPTQLLSAQVIVEILEAAGLPKGVINLVHGDPATIGAATLASSELAGLHFTGSTATFQHLWREIGNNIARYRQYPRIVGETGGKDFIFAHPSANLAALATAIVRGGYEYQGQKCSAASRIYVPRSLAGKLKERLLPEIEGIKMGDPTDFSNFMGAVIDERAFTKISGYVALGKGPGARIVAGGECDRSRGWFVRPTLIEVDDPKHRLMTEEIFGPVVTLWVYDDAKLEEALSLVDESTPYALTGAVFAEDRQVLAHLTERLRFAAGNFYLNDKPTGAVVGQQPFGGGRASGTNDKAGSAANLMRWASTRALKETFVPPTDYRYPFMSEP